MDNFVSKQAFPRWYRDVSFHVPSLVQNHDLFYLGFLKQMDVGIFKKFKNKSKIIKYIHVHVCIPLLKLHRYIMEKSRTINMFYH